ncbi:deoxyribose-phosphate aldolase [Fulvitalea axinellae]
MDKKAVSASEIAGLIDISAVKTESDLKAVNEIIEAAKTHRFICVFPMPGFLEHTIERLKDDSGVLVGGVVGFPSGGESTATKIFQAKENVAKGCDEVDMVMNVAKLKSGLFEEVLEDIIAVRKAIAPMPLKVIIETPLLEESEIAEASRIVMASGADFVKTGTGWSGATTLRHVEIIKAEVGDNVKIKVAGGVRDLDTLLAMRDMGACRFGIGKEAAINIMESLDGKSNGYA